jgi:hypothetical protein
MGSASARGAVVATSVCERTDFRRATLSTRIRCTSWLAEEEIMSRRRDATPRSATGAPPVALLLAGLSSALGVLWWLKARRKPAVSHRQIDAAGGP